MVKDIERESLIAKELCDLKDLEDASNKELEEEMKIDKEIEEYKNTIASSLLSKKEGLTANIDGRIFAIGYEIERKTKLGQTTKALKLIVIDVMLAKLSNRKSGQSTIRLDYVDQMSLRSNLVAAVEAWLRHMTGRIKANKNAE